MIKIFPFIFIILWSSAFVTTKPIIDNSDPFAAAKGSLLSIIGFVVTKADDHKIIKINGKILIILKL